MFTCHYGAVAMRFAPQAQCAGSNPTTYRVFAFFIFQLYKDLTTFVLYRFGLLTLAIPSFLTF